MQNRPKAWNGVEVPYGASIEQLTRLVHGPAPARWAAYVALAHTPGAPALAILADSARSLDPHVRRAAVEAIGVHSEGHHLGDLVCSLLLDTHDFVVRSACEAAAQHRFAEAHDPIVRLLDAKTESTRVSALRALRALWRDVDFERVVEAFAAETSTDVRKEAAWTLRSTASASTWRALFVAWRDDDLPRHREWACELAARYGSRDVLPDLERLSGDVDGHVRHGAAQAIRALEAHGLTRLAADGGSSET